MIVKHLRYAIREKSTGMYIAVNDRLCSEIDRAYLWAEDEIAEGYVEYILDEPQNFEVVKVKIDYEIE